jgi:Mg2+/Co2+ transporter CorB
MDFSIGILLGIIFGLILLSAFFSGAETSLTSASKSRMHTLAKSGKKNAIIFERIFKNKELLICTILLVNNLVNVLASALATSILLELFNTDGIVYVTIIMTFMILLFGELLPKTVALLKADYIALKISPIFDVLVKILYPITISFNSIVNLLMKILNINSLKSNGLESQIESEEELRGAIDLHGDNSKEKQEKEMLKSILDLDDVSVDSIMIPRKNIFSLPITITYEELIDRIQNSPHSRIPIWEKNAENIIGVFYVRKLIGYIKSKNSTFNIMDYCNKPWFIPESSSLAYQLTEFKKRKEHFAIVVDEYGEFLGIVTLEDILEEIVGDIDDELDDMKISKRIKGVKRSSKNNFLVRGNVTIRDLNRELSWQLPDKDASTIAGLVLYESRTIPNIGQVFLFYGYKFEILDKKNNQITLLKISKI